MPRTFALATLILAWLAPCVWAHHVLGIPHYKYSDEYPQIPYLEVIAQVGPHDLDFTYFPGRPRLGESVRFKLYVRDRHEDTVFREPLTAQVYRKRFLRDAVPEGEPFGIHTGTGPESNDYKFFLSFAQPEAYEVRVQFPQGDTFETIPFPVVIGETDDRPLVLGAAALLGIAVVTVGTLKKRRKRTALRARQAAAI